jgi:hypothetical protein
MHGLQSGGETAIENASQAAGVASMTSPSVDATYVTI